jgi:hypothetical protein
MDIVLMTAVVLITLAVVAQACVLIAMYLMSRRVAAKAEALMEESRKLMAPVEAIASNLKTVSDDLTQAGKIVHEEAVHVRNIVTRPIREYSAVTAGIAAAVRSYFSRKKQSREAADERPSRVA